MKLLIVGGGGREHALAWKLGRDNPFADIIAAPGNPGIAALGRCAAVSADDTAGIVALGRIRPLLSLLPERWTDYAGRVTGRAKRRRKDAGRASRLR